MQDKFLESIKTGFISQIEEIINDAKKEATEDKLNAIDTLILVNDKIESWISSIKGIINIDDELLNKVADLKRNFVTAAKKEATQEIARIIECESDVTLKITEYLNELKRKGLDLDEGSKKTARKLNAESTNNLSSSSEWIEPIYDKSPKQRILQRESRKRRTDDDYGSSGGCGSSGCC